MFNAHQKWKNFLNCLRGNVVYPHVSVSLQHQCYDDGMLTAFVLAQSITEHMSQEERNEYFDMMINEVKKRKEKSNDR